MPSELDPKPGDHNDEINSYRAEIHGRIKEAENKVYGLPSDELPVVWIKFTESGEVFTASGSPLWHDATPCRCSPLDADGTTAEERRIEELEQKLAAIRHDARLLSQRPDEIDRAGLSIVDRFASMADDALTRGGEVEA